MYSRIPSQALSNLRARVPGTGTGTRVLHVCPGYPSTRGLHSGLCCSVGIPTWDVVNVTQITPMILAVNRSMSARCPFRTSADKHGIAGFLKRKWLKRLQNYHQIPDLSLAHQIHTLLPMHR
eukprot:2795219-Rhodomonas_salina.2